MLRKEEKGRGKKKGNSRAFYQEDLTGKVTSNSSSNGTLIQETSLGIWVIVLRGNGEILQIYPYNSGHQHYPCYHFRTKNPHIVPSVLMFTGH